MGVGSQHPAALPPGKTRYPLYRRLGGPHGRSGRVRNISPTPGLDPRTFQPVASRYTDWAIPAPSMIVLRDSKVIKGLYINNLYIEFVLHIFNNNLNNFCNFWENWLQGTRSLFWSVWSNLIKWAPNEEIVSICLCMPTPLLPPSSPVL